MTEPERAPSNLPELDRRDDPRGGAAAWALLAVGMALLGGIFLAVMWLTGVW
jgi:formate hydrogenlyase subunit 3/multisubunit Na+/H+ antiporter MnhD subunit